MRNTNAAKDLIALLSEECENLSDVQDMLKHLFKGTIESMPEAEMEEHLGYEKHNTMGNNSGNSRNGYNRKTIKSELGETEIAVPRDRNGEFETVFPKTEQQLCVIHQIRNSTKFVSYKDLKPLMADLKLVYGAPTLDDAEYRLEEFREKWGKKYPQILKSRDTNWAELATYFKFPQEVRTLIYTTNAVEGFHRMLRKFTKTKTIYPTVSCKSAMRGNEGLSLSLWFSGAATGTRKRQRPHPNTAAPPNPDRRSCCPPATHYPPGG